MIGSELLVGERLRYAFHELNLYRLQLTVFDYNERALALYRGLGFQHEGAMRQFLERDGERHDMYLMGLLRPEWQERAESDGRIPPSEERGGTHSDSDGGS